MIELITHCWSGDDVPIYHHMLTLQLHSILHHRPDTPTKITVCYTPDDPRTAQVLADYAQRFEDTIGVSLVGLPLPPSKFFRRAVGRNTACKRTTADVVWFVDVDYMFGEGAIDAAYGACVASIAPMVHPRIVWRCRDHYVGDLILSDVAARDSRVGVAEINAPPSTSHFRPCRERVPIGGLMIVKGDHCREHGYLDGTKWQRPVTDTHFQRCYCDVRYRKSVGDAEPVDIPNVFRLRHSRCGRDRGEVDHAQK